jgi:hypothetical protein
MSMTEFDHPLQPSTNGSFIATEVVLPAVGSAQCHTRRIPPHAARMAIVSFEIVSIPVAYQDRSKVFYRDILSLTKLREESLDPRGKRIELAPSGSATIALMTWFHSIKPGGLQGVMLN